MTVDVAESLEDVDRSTDSLIVVDGLHDEAYEAWLRDQHEPIEPMPDPNYQKRALALVAVGSLAAGVVVAANNIYRRGRA